MQILLLWCTIEPPYPLFALRDNICLFLPVRHNLTNIHEKQFQNQNSE